MARTIAAVVSAGLVLAACSSDANISADTSDANISADTSDGDVRADETFTKQTPPDVDLRKHSVPLEEVVFDTFGSGLIPLTESTPELRAGLLDRIPPIDQPVYADAEDGDWLNPDDLVLGYVSGGDAYAYPIKILNFHEIVNDEIGGVPVLISYCPLCRSAIVYDRRHEGDVLSFSNTSALHESDLVMVDRQTGSYWWQVQGAAIVGPLTGTELMTLPSEMARWGDWTTRHPDTLILTRDTGVVRNYEWDPFTFYDQQVDAGRFAFPVDESSLDDRLPNSTLVVAVEIGDEAVGYPVDALDGPVDDEVGGVAIRITPSGDGAAVHTIEPDGSLGDPVPARTSYWFAIVGAFPDIVIGP